MTTKYKKENTKLLIFDFDGVIANGLDIIFSAYKQIAEKYELKKLKNAEELVDIASDDIFTTIKKLNIPKIKIPFILKEFSHLMKDKHDQIHIYKGIPEVIKELSKHHTLTIISSNHSNIIKDTLDHQKLNEYFHKIIGAEFSFHKTKKIEHCMKHFKATPQTTVFISDTVADIIEAKKAKVKTIATTWGYHTWKESDIKPDHFVNKPKELIKAIEKD